MEKIIIIPIRDDSSRFKNKATGFKLYKEHTPLECIIKRLEEVNADKIIFIMPDTEANMNICSLISTYKMKYNPKPQINYFKGSINDISGRAIQAINFHSSENKEKIIINITGDCPLIDKNHINNLIKEYEYYSKLFPIDYIYVSNVITRSWPDGFDIQVFGFDLLKYSRYIALDKKVTTNLGWDIVNYSGYFQGNIRLYNYPASEEYWYPDWGLTLDYKEDAVVIKEIYQYFGNFDFTYEQIIEYLKKYPDVLKYNKKCRRNIPGE